MKVMINNKQKFSTQWIVFSKSALFSNKISEEVWSYRMAGSLITNSLGFLFCLFGLPSLIIGIYVLVSW